VSLEQPQAECRHRVVVRAPGYAGREVVEGGADCDIILGWRGADGSAVFSDIGGQKERGWNSDEGRGGLFRLRPDNGAATIEIRYV
jgi:hypothetical protein